MDYLFTPERTGGLHAQRAHARHRTRNQRDGAQNSSRGEENNSVGRLDVGQQTGGGESQPLSGDHREHVGYAGSECNPDAQLSRALRDAIGEYAIDPDRRQDQRQARKARERTIAARLSTTEAASRCSIV